MIKFVIILLASFFALTLFCGFFPGFSTATLAVGEHSIRWYWIGLAGLVAGCYKAIG